MNTGSFPVVGDAVLSYVSRGGSARPNTKYEKVVAKQTEGRGSSPTGKSAIRGSTMIHEANGPKCHIVSKLYSANAAEASATTRNVRVVPSAVGVGDFWKKRSYGTVY